MLERQQELNDNNFSAEINTRSRIRHARYCIVRLNECQTCRT